MDTLYDDDFVLWTERQAESLRLAARQGSNLPLDWENLAEEIESVGRSERRRVGTLVSNIIAHLLKLAYSPSDRDRSGWESEIGSARDYLRRTLDESPSLKPGFPDIVAREQPGAARAAVRSLRKYGERDAAARLEAGAPTITAGQVLDDDFYLPGSFPTPEQTLP
jgi:hypothetical protein